MKAIINKLLLLAAILCITACEKQGDKIYLSSLEEGELVSSESEVALSMANSKQIVLSLAWNNSDLSVSDPSMRPPIWYLPRYRHPPRKHLPRMCLNR